VIAYRKFVDELCNGLWLTPEGAPMRPQWGAGYNLEPSPAAHRGNDECAAKLKRVGLQGAHEIVLCSSANAPAVPVASGAFVKSGTDEVLLQVGNGRRWPADGQSLALMRDDGRGYRFVEHMLRASSFKPLVRFTTPNGRDALMLCRVPGPLDPPTGVCGFLGQGSFGGTAQSIEGDTPCAGGDIIESPESADRRGQRDLEAAVADPNEIALDSGPKCGRGRSVALGKVEPRGGRLFVNLVVEESLREPGPEDLDGSSGCSRVTTTARQPLTIEYAFDGVGFRRTAPIPQAAQDRPTERGRSAVLMEYADGGWQSRIVSGPAVADVERWLAALEARPRLPGRASGKPLAWLHLVEGTPGPSDQLRASRSIGLLTDVLRALDRSFSSQELEALRAIFARQGRPFQGAVEPR
jgi:hypothetical protein